MFIILKNDFESCRALQRQHSVYNFVTRYDDDNNVFDHAWRNVTFFDFVTHVMLVALTF